MNENDSSPDGNSPLHAPWPDREVEMLVRLIREGKNLDELCRLLHRDPASVCFELSRLAIRRPGAPPSSPPRRR